MGLLKHLLFWPATAPAYLTRFSLGKVRDAVHRELTDDSAVKEALLELQLELEVGDIDEAEYDRREAELMQRFRDVRRWRERLGMSTPGGPVRVATAGEDDAAEVESRAGHDEPTGR